MRCVLALVASSTLLVTVSSAVAQTAPDSASALDELKRGAGLRKQGKCAEAMPLLVDSLRLAPNVKTLLNLADCEERLGRLLDAEQHWVQARELAASQGNAAVKEEASARLGALEPRVPRLTLVLSAGADPSSRVTRDGVAVASAWLGVAVPVDPGHHVVEVIADGHAKGAIEVDLAEKEAKRLEVAPGPATPSPEPLAAARAPEPSPPPDPKPEAPTVVPAPAAAADPAMPPPDASRRSPLFYVGVGAAALGVVGVGLGVVEGLLAQKDHADALDNCGSDCASSSTAQGLQTEARNAATLSTVSYVAGAGLAAAGVVTVVLAAAGGHPQAATPAQSARRASWAPLFGRTVQGLALEVPW